MCELETTIENVLNQADGMNSERTTISSGIDNILRSCGWDTGNNSEYKREVRLNKNSVADIVLYPNVSSTILIESKKYGRMPEGIGLNEWKKFRGYTNKLQPCMAIMSDSRYWEFYDLVNGKISKYPFFEIDLANIKNKELYYFGLLLGKDGYSKIDLVRKEYKNISKRELIDVERNNIINNTKEFYSYICEKNKERNLELFIDDYSVKKNGLVIYMNNILKSKCYIDIRLRDHEVISRLYICDKNDGLYKHLLKYRAEIENDFCNNILVWSDSYNYASIESSKYFFYTQKESWNEISEYINNIVDMFHNVFFEKIKFVYN